MTMTVKTSKGEIEAVNSTDPNYPGIWIKVNGEELVLVELDENEIAIRVWNQNDPDGECEYKQVIK